VGSCWTELVEVTNDLLQVYDEAPLEVAAREWSSLALDEYRKCRVTYVRRPTGLASSAELIHRRTRQTTG
jgi:hypothetical protein